MAAITYTANARAPLVAGHTAGSSYSIDLKLQQFSEQIETPKTAHVSIGGTVETVLKRAVKIYQVVFIWPHTENTSVEEFLYSVAGGETFTLSPYGDVGDSPDLAESVVYTGSGYSVGRMTHGSTPWRSVGMTLRPVV